jgi:hypothetical protein
MARCNGPFPEPERIGAHTCTNHHLFGIQYRLMRSVKFARQKVDFRPVLNKFGGFASVIGY